MSWTGGFKRHGACPQNSIWVHSMLNCSSNYLHNASCLNWSQNETDIYDRTFDAHGDWEYLCRNQVVEYCHRVRWLKDYRASYDLWCSVDSHQGLIQMIYGVIGQMLRPYQLRHKSLYWRQLLVAIWNHFPIVSTYDCTVNVYNVQCTVVDCV